MPRPKHPTFDLAPLAPKRRKPVPYEFVLDALSSIPYWTRPMFGCIAIYVGEKIVLILRDKPNHDGDNGVWLATTHDQHASLRRDFPSMRSITVLGKKVTGWQVLPAAAPDFESAALRACELVISSDPRIGKIPGAKRPRTQPRSTAGAAVEARSERAKRAWKSRRA